MFRVIFILSLIFFLGFSSKKYFKQDISQQDISQKVYYYNKDSSYNLYLIKSSDSLYGQHCFIYTNGSKIDCSDESKISIRVKKKSKDIYVGSMQSFYDDKIYKIQIAIVKNELILTMLTNDHVFLSKVTNLYSSIQSP